LFVARQPTVAQGLLIHKISRSHTTHNRQASMPPVGSETTISAGERPQTYALDRAATGTGYVWLYYHKIHIPSGYVVYGNNCFYSENHMAGNFTSEWENHNWNIRYTNIVCIYHYL